MQIWNFLEIFLQHLAEVTHPIHLAPGAERDCTSA
jgi:hypothetical protein